jgi:DNA modification methylase
MTLRSAVSDVPSAPGRAVSAARRTRRNPERVAWRSRIVGHGEEPPAQLVPNERNWRRHPPGQQKALAGALAEVGWVQQVIVNRTTGRLVDGHLRVELALARGEAAVPVTYVDLSEEEERVVLATLDPIGTMAEADAAKLEQLLRDLAPADADLGAMLAELAERHGIATPGLTDPDAVPPLPDDEALYVAPGDLWLLGDHRLLCGDATDPAAVARLLGEAQPTLLATDPPYGVQLDSTWRDGIYNTKGPATRPYMMRTDGHRNTAVSGDTRVDWSAAFALVPSLSVGYVWHAGQHAAEVARGLEAIGFEIVSQVIWDKGLFAMGRSWYHWRHEPCWVVRRRGAKVAFRGERDQSTVWPAPSPKMIMGGSKEAKFDHPTQKPVLVFETPIRNHLTRGEAVYDPFLGSGTALMAAERLGRRAYALEIEPRYVQLAIERWQAFTGRAAVRADG